jgi:hypothetical protein
MLQYRPILADKRAEMHALASLPDGARARMVPIIQVRHPERPEKAARDWNPTSKLLDVVQDPDHGLIGCWGLEQPIGLDVSRLNLRQFDEPPLDLLFERCADLGIAVVPTTGRGMPNEVRRAAAQAARRLGYGASIRLVDDELKVGTVGLRGLLSELDIPQKSIDLVFDLGTLPDGSIFLLSELVSSYLKNFGPLDSWRSVSIVSSAFPLNLSERVQHNSFDFIPRSEKSLWERVCQTIGNGFTPGFGDYGVVSADTSLAFRGAANLRYATKESWYVLRGDNPDLADRDYLRLATELCESDIWRGPDHCPGCSLIQRQLDVQKPGNATQWRQAGFAHHFAVVSEG